LKRTTLFAIIISLIVFCQTSIGVGGLSAADTGNRGIGTYTNASTDCPKPNDVDYSSIIRHWPLDNIKFNQYYSWYHPADDLAATYREPIYSVGYGHVSKSAWSPEGYGYYVVIDHAQGWQTLYGHMVQQPEVKEGDYVYPGKVIGFAGSTGHSTGVHVHFEVTYNGCYLNPKTVIDGS
jgi:murein DD-endopeptidase MepM/ murein hydrolase activator NlpD